jgi:hypothetical protein
MGLLLPKGSMLRDWHRHPENRLKLHNLLAENPLQCSLLVMDAAEFHDTYHDDYEEGAIFQSIVASEKIEFTWVLLEPLPSDGVGKLRWRKWNQTSVVFFDEFHTQDAHSVVENPFDANKRRWSPDALQLCHHARKRFMSDDADSIVKGVLVKTLRNKLKYAAAGTLALGVIACSVATAVCTGTGALTLSVQLAQGIVKGAATSAGERAFDAAWPRVSNNEAQQLLETRVQALEHAMFTKTDSTPVQIRNAGNAVAHTLRTCRGKPHIMMLKRI